MESPNEGQHNTFGRCATTNGQLPVRTRQLLGGEQGALASGQQPSRRLLAQRLGEMQTMMAHQPGVVALLLGLTTIWPVQAW